MSDTILFPTIDSSHWAGMFENHRQQAPAERNPLAAQIRDTLASEVHNPRLVLMLAIQRASNDGFEHFARALKAEFVRLYGSNSQQGSSVVEQETHTLHAGSSILPPAPNLAANNGVTNSGDPAGMPARKVEAGQAPEARVSGALPADSISLYNREPSVTNRPTTAPSAGAKVETVTPVMSGQTFPHPSGSAVECDGSGLSANFSAKELESVGPNGGRSGAEQCLESKYTMRKEEIPTTSAEAIPSAGTILPLHGGLQPGAQVTHQREFATQGVA